MNVYMSVGDNSMNHMNLIITDKYRAYTDAQILGYQGETNARTIKVAQPHINEVTAYRLIFDCGNDVIYEVDVTDGEYIVDSGLLINVGTVKCQWQAVKLVGDTYELVAKSNIIEFEVKPSIQGDVAPIPTYEQSKSALDEVLEAAEQAQGAKAAAERAETAAITATQASEIAEQAKSETIAAAETATQKATEAEQSATTAAESATSAGQSKTAAEAAANSAELLANAAAAKAAEAVQAAEAAEKSSQEATDKAAEISASAEQISENTENISQINAEIESARKGYMGKVYNSLGDRIDGDINSVLDKVDTVNYKDTSIHAANTYARNLTVNGGKVEILGQTIQNCLDHSSAEKFSTLKGTVDEEGYITMVANGVYLACKIKTDYAIVKPNTTYTLIMDIKELSIVPQDTARIEINQHYNDETTLFTSIIIKNVSELNIGINKFVLQSREDIENATFALRTQLTNSAISGTIKFRYAIIEGDWTNKEVSFVPFGLNTPQTTEVKMIGKNLFNADGAEDNKYQNSNISTGNFGIGSNTNYWITGFIPVSPGKRYHVNLTHNGGAYYDINKNPIKDDRISAGVKIIDTNNSAYFIILTFEKSTTPFDKAKEMQFELGDIATGYESYTENTVTINQPLGSVSDTVRDRVYLKDGKAYFEQNTIEVVFDGSEDELWTIAVKSDTPTPYKIAGITLAPESVNQYDRFFKNNRFVNTSWNDDSQIVSFIDNYNVLRIGGVPLADNLVDVPTFRNYLKNNPLVIRYQISPITTEISLHDFYSYAEQTNWYTTNTIKPTFDVDIPSNLSAVVSSLMVENESLQSENQSLASELENQKNINAENTELMNVILGVYDESEEI